MLKIYKSIFFTVILSTFSTLSAQTKFITGFARVTMGSNTTEIQAIEIAKIQAEIDACEKAGIYIESQTEVRNSMLVKDIISTFSAEILKQINFSHKKTITNDVIYIDAEGVYEVDVNIFYERVNALQRENKLREALNEYIKKYNLLLNQINLSENYESRKKLLDEYQSLRKSAKVLYIRDELILTNRRIRELKNEFHNKLKKFHIYMCELSNYYIESKNITTKKILINIECDIKCNKEIENEIKEIIGFGIEKSVLGIQNLQMIDKTDDFFNFEIGSNLKLFALDSKKKILYSVPLSFFTFGFTLDTRIEKNRSYYLLLCDNSNNSKKHFMPFASFNEDGRYSIGSLSTWLNRKLNIAIEIPNDTRISTIIIDKYKP